MNAPAAIRRDPRDRALATAPDRTKGALTSIAHGLAELRHADDFGSLVDGVADVLRHRLDRDQRGLLLMTAAQAAEPENLEALAVAVIEGAGSPSPTFDNLRAEASAWAAFSSKAQIRAYVAAGWAALPNHERRDFIAAARGR